MNSTALTAGSSDVGTLSSDGNVAMSFGFVGRSAVRFRYLRGNRGNSFGGAGDPKKGVASRSHALRSDDSSIVAIDCHDT